MAQSYTWENGRQLKTLTNSKGTWTYTYDADGMRTGRTNGTTTYEYIYAGDKLVRMVKNGEVVDFGYAGNQLATMTYDGVTYYYVLNGQGDVVALTDSTGTMIIGYHYSAYGCPVLLKTDYNAYNDLKYLNPFLYRGYAYDIESTLYYLQSRYYDPELGRFINADALVSTGQGFLGNNMYAYCHNNPVLYTDPSGYIIVLSPRATEEEIEEYERAIAYLQASKTGKELLEKLDASSVKITIIFWDNGNMFYDAVNNTIYVDINSGLILGDGSSVQSAALGLAHEMGHAAQDLDGIYFTFATREELEASNLEMWEIPIANELGEPTRICYDDCTGEMEMQNSIHFRTTDSSSRPWWHYILAWYLLEPYTIDHNVS